MVLPDDCGVFYLMFRLLGAYLTSLTWRPGGNDCFNFSAFSLSATTNVYKKREQRILNLVFNGFFLILTARASFRRALIRKSFTSLISFGISIQFTHHTQLPRQTYTNNNVFLRFTLHCTLTQNTRTDDEFETKNKNKIDNIR